MVFYIMTTFHLNLPNDNIDGWPSSDSIIRPSALSWKTSNIPWHLFKSSYTTRMKYLWNCAWYNLHNINYLNMGSVTYLQNKQFYLWIYIYHMFFKHDLFVIYKHILYNVSKQYSGDNLIKTWRNEWWKNHHRVLYR